MESNFHYDPDAMAQQHADQAQSDHQFQISPLQTNDTMTREYVERAKADNLEKNKNLHANCPFIKIPVLIKPNQHGIAIEITGEYFIENGCTVYIDYKIQGSAEKGAFETIKGYVDFLRIREIFVKSWPGCKIPTLPHPSLFGNYQESEGEARRNGLVNFLKEVVSFPYLFYSADFQEFIKSGSSSPKEQIAFIRQNSSQSRVPIFFKSAENIVEQIPVHRKTNNENKKNKHGIAIYIAGEFRNEHNSILYIDYHIKVSSDENGELETVKGYLDFVLMRERLVAGWPGCAIPPLPPANLFRNYRDSNGEARKNGLMKFLKDAAGFPFLFYSAHFQEFLKSGPSPSKLQTDFIKNDCQLKNRSLVSKVLDVFSGKDEESKNPSLSVQKKSFDNSNSQYNPPLVNHQKQDSQIPNQVQKNENKNDSIKSVPPQIQNPSVTIVGDFMRANSFGIMHKEYHIRGYDHTGMFQVNRRYTDFVLIREILVEKWPEIKFQELPPKERLHGQNEANFEQARAKGLIAFLQHTMLEPSVFHSPEWQMFTKDQSYKISDKLKHFKKSAGIFSMIFGFAN